MEFVKRLYSAEFLFAGFLLSSVFKNIFENVTIDLTIVFFILSMFAGLKNLYFESKISTRIILPMGLFFSISFLIVLSYIYSPSKIYAFQKTLKFLTMTTWSFIGPLILIKNKKSLDLFLKGFLFYGISTIIYVNYSYYLFGDAGSRFGVNGEDVLGLARMAGMMIIIISSMYLYKKRDFKQKFIALIGALISTLVLLRTGSRMPLISCLISLSLLFPFSITFKKEKGFLINNKIMSFFVLFIIGIFLLIPMYLNGMFNNIHSRMLLLFDSGPSVNARVNIYQTSLKIWTESPILGKGIGGFSMYHYGRDAKGYSHNIFLEFLSELGLVGLFLVVTLFLGAILIILKCKKLSKLNSTQIAIILTFVFLLLNAQTTGDMNDNRILFTYIALIYMLPHYQDNEKIDLNFKFKLAT